MMAIFGDEDEESYTDSIENHPRGMFATPTDGDGVADYISVYLTVTIASHKVKCALYDGGSLIKSTEERTISVSSGWQDFNFDAPKSSVTNNHEYVLYAWAESVDGDCTILRSSVLYGAGWEKGQTYNSWPDPFGGWGYNKKISMYCSYTPSGAAVEGINRKTSLLLTLGILNRKLQAHMLKRFQV